MKKQSKPKKLTQNSSLQNSNKSSPQTLRFPLHSPATPSTPFKTNPLTFSPLPEEKDYESILEEFSNRGQKSSNELLEKLLDQKEKLLEEQEKEINRLETEKVQLLTENETLQKDNLKIKQLEKTLLQKNKKFEELKTELKETENDVYQFGEEKDELNHLLHEERLNSRKLEKKLEQQVNENDWLKESFQQTKTELLEKANELTRLKKLEKQEKEEWWKIFTEQEKKYETEKKEREKVFNKQINNLRTFQLTTDNPISIGRGRALHKKSFSLSLPGSRSASPRGSFYEKDSEFSQKEPNLFSELQKANYVNSPLKESSNPLEEVNSQIFDDLLNEVDNFANESTQEQVNNQELLTEIQQLKEEKLHLEKNYKVLADEKVEHERLLQNFNQKELNWEKERKEFEKLLFNYTQKEQDLIVKNQSLMEELNETKYQLSETKSKKNQVEKSNKEVKNQLKLKEEENERLNNELAQQKLQEAQDDEELRQILVEAEEEAEEIQEMLFNQIMVKPK